LKIGSVKGNKVAEVDDDALMFGEGVPFGDPSWYQAFNSPFYSDSHRKLRSFMRSFVDNELMPYCHEWDESGDFVPRSVFQRCGEIGILTAGMPLEFTVTVCGAPWPKELTTIKPPGGVDPLEFDSFHEFIVKDELSRAASGGTLWGLMGGHTVSQVI
jgi:alkylation response protein AidB-like acyl-CoA dehydrogenase